MRLPIPRLGLPLLAKELVEQAARRRTYVVRVVYAILLFVAGFAFYYQIVTRYSSSPLAVLGHGRELFVAIVMLQFAGIYLFMPAMTCGVIALEKERNSLGLLFLTRLGPWTILLEKYLARVIPMFSFLILSLPMLVIAYALGGITQQFLWTGIWFLSLTVFQMGALALLCSSFFRTTVAAFITSYLLTAFMLFIVPILDALLGLHLSSIADGLIMRSGLIELLGPPWWIPWPFCGPAIFQGAESRTVLQILIASCPILLLTSSFLFLSRAFLVRRAFLSPTNLMRRVFKSLDAFFHRLNEN